MASHSSSAAPYAEDDGALTAEYAGARRLLTQQFRGGAAPLGTFARHWVLTVAPVAATLALAAAWPGAATWTLAALTAGFAQNGLGLLMHEGSHWFFHPDRRVNDLVADALVCLPIFNTVEGYRVPHLEHHRHAGTPRDPYVALYAGYGSPRRVLLSLVADLFAASAILKFGDRYVASAGPRARLGPRTAAALALAQGGLFVGYWALTGVWWAYLVLWLAPLLVVPQVVNRIRTIAEHAPEAEGDGGANRSTVTGWCEYLLVAPYGYSYHFEHHLAPTVPYYQLADAHRLLRARGWTYTRRDVTDGYLRTFWRLTRAMRPAR
jgi:fatty acid desaturase